MGLSFILDAYMISPAKKVLVTDVIHRIFRVVVFIVLNIITLVIFIPSKNAEALVCIYYVRAIAINITSVSRFYHTGEELFQSKAFLLSYILSVSSQSLQCYCAFAANYANIVFAICVLLFSLSLLLQTILCLRWFYQIKGPFNKLSVSKVNTGIFFIVYILSSMIYAFLVIANKGAYTIAPLVTSNYMYCILVLTATFVAKRNIIMEVLLTEVCNIFIIYYYIYR